MPRTSHVTHIKSRKPSAKAESFLFVLATVVNENFVITCRSVPAHNAVDTYVPPLNFGIPFAVTLKSS